MTAVVGELDLGYEVMKLVADEELTMFVYVAEPGSRSQESLSLLASWAATVEQEQPDIVHEPSEQET